MKLTPYNLLIISFLSTFYTVTQADPVNNPCGGPYGLLNVVDRPTASDSACVVPFQKALLEMGYQYNRLTLGNGYGQNIPEAEFRLGLPHQNEFVLVLPNYYHQTTLPYNGFSAATVGLKHEIMYTQKIVTAVEALFSLSGGSDAYGNKAMGTAFNGILNYVINPQFNITFMLGVTTDTLPAAYGGARYTSVNPDGVLTYVATQKLNFFAEVYGQSKTAPHQGSGFNFDGGVLYLVRQYCSLDLEFGQRISGNLNGFENYVGAGLALQFG